ncbi:putative DNA binding domain-containing protein [Corynebacterium hindlerae]|uniref:ATP-binding protein n=1 Tax=Corynebacterium hindlerae TaxID=699041 RepID=UPI001AD68E4A|nr:RNA-binding domain-containing protein [Corynebacterium hindlerae]QTH60292.1 putative DNA binding domain-containing protein [Corynebacterium hindlerae]
MQLNSGEVKAVLAELRSRRGDSASIEVKAAQGGLPADIGATVCAFANMPNGGTVMLGIGEERNFEILGVSEPAQLEAGLIEAARMSVDPCPHINSYVVQLQQKQVVIANIQGLDPLDRPARFHGKAYLRQSDGNYEMSATELRMLESSKLQVDVSATFEQRPVADTAVEDLDPALVAKFLSAARTRISRLAGIADDHKLLRTLGVTTATGELTLAGLYGLGNFPQGPLPSLAVTCAVRLPRSDTARLRNLETFHGPVPDLIQAVMQWVARNLDTVEQYQPDGHMKTVLELPLPAIREAVANALVHRDLRPLTVESGKSIDIRLEPGKLVIASPGGLKALSLDQLLSEELTRAEVNQRLYRIAKLITDPDGNSIIEGEGGGIQEILRQCERHAIAPPTFVDTGVKFTTIFWRNQPEQRKQKITASHDPVEILSLGKNAPLIYLVAQTKPDGFSLHDLEEELSLTEAQIRYALAPLLKKGIIHRDGGQGKKNTSYRLAP